MDLVTQDSITSTPLPLLIQPKKNLSITQTLDFVQENLPELKQAILKHGGILFRSFPIEHVDAFSQMVSSLDCGQRLDYIAGDSPRDKVKGKVYTSTEASPSFKIPLHGELSYQNQYPTHIFFWCDTPPVAHGETILGSAKQVLATLDPEVAATFENNGLKYVSRYWDKDRIMAWSNKVQKGHKSWRQAFDTDNREEAEEKCRAAEYDYHWYDNGWLEIERNCPATAVHPTTGEKVWFNQVHTFDFNPRFLGWLRYIGGSIFYSRKNTRVNDVYFGDGEKIPREMIYHVLDTLDRCTVKFPWQKGDFLVLDNILAMHGRATFKGSRRILTALTKKESAA